jgi:light-regulated signal transduction histidine kinase (bacteriophytochrome)
LTHPRWREKIRTHPTLFSLSAAVLKAPVTLMNQSLPHVSDSPVSTQEKPLHQYTSDEFVHELRQPLSVIDAVAYYLELTCKDKSASSHLQQIQAMVREANRIVAQASQTSPAC